MTTIGNEGPLYEEHLSLGIKYATVFGIMQDHSSALHLIKLGMQGKYLDQRNASPESRLLKYKGRYAEAESRYGPKPNVHAALQAYCGLAQEAGIEPYELALR